ncbi:hypothetical protein ABZY03_12865 [Streptomyces klenkii]
MRRYAPVGRREIRLSDDAPVPAPGPAPYAGPPPKALKAAVRP